VKEDENTQAGPNSTSGCTPVPDPALGGWIDGIRKQA